jgi:hypothetical protein
MVALALDGYVHLELRQAIWGLPQAGILANKCLPCKLAPFGYYKHTNTSGLWYHKSHPISFTLVVEDFSVKYVNKDDVDHLIASINSTYTLTKDWTGNLYCGIALNWDYVNCTVNISSDTSRKKCRSITTSCHGRGKHAPTHLPLSNMALRLKLLSLPTH